MDKDNEVFDGTTVDSNTRQKKGVSFSDSTEEKEKDKLKEDVTITVDNPIESPKDGDDKKSEIPTPNPIKETRNTDENDPFTVVFMIISWILILVTFPISVFSCFKMVQVKH